MSNSKPVSLHLKKKSPLKVLISKFPKSCIGNLIFALQDIC